MNILCSVSLAVLLLCFAASVSTAEAGNPPKGQQAYTFETQITKTVRLNYLLFLPKGYGENPEQKWPLILFLHGAGERGDDIELVKKRGQILNLGRTRAKTHQVLYDFSPTQKNEHALLDRIRAFQKPLIVTTDPEYFCRTDALGPLSPADAPEIAEYDRNIRESFEMLHHEREASPRENGMLHYGDYYHGGYGNELTRGDLEYDTGHACFLLFL